MAISYTDFLQQVVGGVTVPWQDVWVRLVSNSSGTAYISDTATSSLGKFTFASKPPSAAYTVYTGASNTGPWSATGDVAYVVPDDMGVLNPFDYGCKGDGVTDDTTGLQSWITALKTSGSNTGGGGILPVGNFVFTSLLDMSGPNSVVIRGVGRERSVLTYTGGNIPIALNMARTYNKLADLQVTYTNAAFTSTLVSFAGSVAEPCVDGCLLWGNGVSTAQYLLDVTLATTITLRDTQFTNSQYAILGTKIDGTNPSNGARIENCYFGGGLTVAHIRNPGNGWDIQADCENLANGKAAHIVMDAASSAQGLSLHGMWMGDATDVTLWTWIQFQGSGLSITGSYIHGTGANASHAVDIIGTSNGIHISGNQMDHHAVGVALGSSIATGVEIAGNSWANTTAAISGTALAPFYIQGNAGAAGGLALLTNSGISFAAEGPALDRVGTQIRLNAGGAASYVAVTSGGFVRATQTPTEAVLVSGVSATSGDFIEITLSASRLVGAPVSPLLGQELTFTFIQNGTGGFAVTWNAVFKVTWSDTGNTANKRSTISFWYDGTNWNQKGAQTAYV